MRTSRPTTLGWIASYGLPGMDEISAAWGEFAPSDSATSFSRPRSGFFEEGDEVVVEGGAVGWGGVAAGGLEPLRGGGARVLAAGAQQALWALDREGSRHVFPAVLCVGSVGP